VLAQRVGTALAQRWQSVGTALAQRWHMGASWFLRLSSSLFIFH
jgi:hypothetical protein